MTLSEMLLRRIRVRMAVINWNQSDLAGAMGKSKVWVSRIMTGRNKLQLDDVGGFAKALGIPEDFLLTGKSSRYEGPEEPERGKGH